MIIVGTKAPYKNKKIKIRIEFDDEYPKIPPKMYVERTKKVPFLHANVYNDNGEICHQLLTKNEKSNLVKYLEGEDVKFTVILKKIQELLYNPNFSNPADFALRAEYLSNRQNYEWQIEENAGYL